MCSVHVCVFIWQLMKHLSNLFRTSQQIQKVHVWPTENVYDLSVTK